MRDFFTAHVTHLPWGGVVVPPHRSSAGARRSGGRGPCTPWSWIAPLGGAAPRTKSTKLAFCEPGRTLAHKTRNFVDLCGAALASLLPSVSPGGGSPALAWCVLPGAAAYARPGRRGGGRSGGLAVCDGWAFRPPPHAAMVCRHRRHLLAKPDRLLSVLRVACETISTTQTPPALAR